MFSILLALPLLAITTNLLLVILARDKFRREVRDARAEGLYRPIELFAVPALSPEENAATLYRKAFAELQPPPGDAALYVQSPDPQEEAQALRALAALLDKARPGLEDLHLGGLRPRCRFDSCPTDSVYAPLRFAGRWLGLAGRGALADGHIEEAYRDLVDRLALSDAASGQADDLEYRITLAMRHEAMYDVRRALQRDLPSSEALARVAAVLERTDPAGRLERWFSTGPGDVEGALRKFRKGDLGTWPSATRPQGSGAWMYHYLGWTSYRDWACAVGVRREACRLAQRPYYDAAPDLQAMVARVEAAPGWYYAARSDAKWFQFFLQAQARDRARHDGARLVIAAARYKVGHGAWPASLAALVPEFLPSLPLDPFTGKPFVYLRAGGSARIYSLGMAGADAGGGTPDQEEDDGNILLPLGDQAPFAGK